MAATTSDSDLRVVNDLCNVCGSAKGKGWHLVCVGCWEVLPVEIQEELYAAFLEEPKSQRHYSAMRAAYAALFVEAELSEKKDALVSEDVNHKALPESSQGSFNLLDPALMMKGQQPVNQ